MFGEQDVEDGEGLLSQTSTQEGIISTSPRAGSGIERIDSLHFLAGCRKRRLNQALSFLLLSLVFFECVCFAINQGHFLSCVFCMFCLLVVLRLPVPVQVIDWKDLCPQCLNYMHGQFTACMIS